MRKTMVDLPMNPKEVTTVLKEFIKTYVDSAGCSSVVLGLSGGVDSAVCALLCKDALGVRNVHCMFLPDQATPSLDRKHLKLFVDTVHVPCTEIDITSFVELFSAAFQQKKRLTLANIKPRVRMTLLYKYANELGGLVCGTSNKSEILIGYFTKYGDGGVDLQPLGDLYKTQIYQLARYLNIPAPIIRKPPTAGLWVGQTDEKEIRMSYQTLDCILFGLEQKLDVGEIQKASNASKEQIERIRMMRLSSQHKRRFPLVPKMGIRTPGLDWRSPVQEG
ncbi:MAG: NAD+ synthase [Candidatus Thermoplasmatota archaeon]